VSQWCSVHDIVHFGCEDQAEILRIFSDGGRYGLNSLVGTSGYPVGSRYSFGTPACSVLSLGVAHGGEAVAVYSVKAKFACDFFGVSGGCVPFVPLDSATSAMIVILLSLEIATWGTFVLIPQIFGVVRGGRNFPQGCRRWEGASAAGWKSNAGRHH
jgi:hypothetical protein